MLKVRNELATEALGVEIVKVGKKYTTVIVPKGELHKVLMRLGVRYAEVAEVIDLNELKRRCYWVGELKREHLVKDIIFTTEADVKVAKWNV